MSVRLICLTLGIQRSSYYAWKTRPSSKRESTNHSLLLELRRAHKESKGTYGAPRLTAHLKVQGRFCGRHRVARLMRRDGLFGCARRKFRPPGTTDSKHTLPIAPRIFRVQSKACFPPGPNQVWVSDTTYIATQEGWLYLTIQLDVFTRKVVGYTMSDHLKSEATWESMKEALKRQPEALSISAILPLIAHSDRGVQYASDLYRGKLSRLGITQSMSRSGNCYDNAYAESFFHTLKVELVHRQAFRTRAEARNAISSYIEEWYNRKRLHSALGYRAPNDYEQQALTA